jgi:hypothetical protein
MIGGMKNRVRAALVVAACLIGLTGCVKFDADLQVGSGETVSGDMKLGVDKKLLESSGQPLDKIREQIERGIKSTATDGVDCKAYEDDTYVGSTCTFKDVPFEQMGTSSGDGVKFSKEGDKIKVVVNADDLARNVPSSGQPEVNFKITMPGKILEHDDGAQISGRTATYDSVEKLGNISLTSESGGGFPVWALILIIVLVLLALGAGAFFFLRGRRSKAQQGYGQQFPGQYPGQPGQYPGQPGQYPGQPGQYPGQPGQPGQYGGPGQYPGQPGYGQQYGQPGQPGPQYPGQPGQYGGQPGQYGGQPGQYPGQPQGQPGQGQPYGGQPGQPGPQQYPGQPQQGQGPWGGQPPQQQAPGGWGRQPGQGQQPGGPQQGSSYGQQPPQQGGPSAPQQGGWGPPPKDDDGQA